MNRLTSTKLQDILRKAIGRTSDTLAIPERVTRALTRCNLKPDFNRAWVNLPREHKQRIVVALSQELEREQGIEPEADILARMSDAEKFEAMADPVFAAKQDQYRQAKADREGDAGDGLRYRAFSLNGLTAEQAALFCNWLRTEPQAASVN